MKETKQMCHNEEENELFIRLPNDFEEIELCMSNLCGTIDEGFAEALKNKKTFGNHFAWNFKGFVYWSNGNFNTDVWCYGIYQETLSEDTLEELMISVNMLYGSE